MHLILSRRDSELDDDVLHDYVRAGFSGEMLWRIERRIASNRHPRIAWRDSTRLWAG